MTNSNKIVRNILGDSRGRNKRIGNFLTSDSIRYQIGPKKTLMIVPYDDKFMVYEDDYFDKDLEATTGGEQVGPMYNTYDEAMTALHIIGRRRNGKIIPGRR